MPQLMIRLRPPTPPAPAVAAVSGDVDRSNASMLGQQLDGVLDDGLVLDVSGVDFLDLGGLRAMLALDARLRRTGRRLVLASPPCPVRLLLDNIALDDPLDTSPTVEQAVERASTRGPLESGS